MPFSLRDETVSSQEGTITAEEIDAIVTAQADDDAAWEQPVSVRKTDAGSKRDPMTKRRTVSKRTKQMVMLEDEQVALLPISSDPEILSGATVFRGTRVPVAACWTIWRRVSRWTNFLITFHRSRASRHCKS